MDYAEKQLRLRMQEGKGIFFYLNYECLFYHTPLHRFVPHYSAFTGPTLYKPAQMVPTKSTDDTPEISGAQKAFEVKIYPCFPVTLQRIAHLLALV